MDHHDHHQGFEMLRLFKDVMGQWKQNISRVYEQFGMTAPQGMLLGLLSRHGRMKIHELGRELALSDSTVSGMIDRLEKMELAVRTRDSGDKRVVYVDLTPKSAEMRQQLKTIMEKAADRVLTQATGEEMARVIDGLTILKRIFEQQQTEKKGE